MSGPNTRVLAQVVASLALVLVMAACATSPAAESSDPTTADAAAEGRQANSDDEGDAWRMFGRDYANSRTSTGTAGISPSNVTGLTPIWEWEGAAVTSTPAVVDGVVYFADWDGNLVALDAATGAEVWMTRLQATQLSPSPFVSEDTVYIAGDGSIVYAVDRETGAEVWSVDAETTPNDRIWSSPVVVDGTVIIGTASYQVFFPATPAFQGSVVGLDAATGEERWRASVCPEPCTGVSVWSSAAVDRELKMAYIGTGQAYTSPAGEMSDSIVAVNYESGEIVWHHQFTAGDSYRSSNPAGPDFDVGAAPNLFEVDGRRLVGVGDKGGRYKAFDRETGEVIWETRLVAGTTLGGVEHTTAYADGVVYVVGNTQVAATSRADAVPSKATAFAVSAVDGSILWRTDLDAGGFGGVAVANGLMYFTTHDGRLHALNTADGSVAVAIPIGTGAAGGPSVVDGVVYVGHGWDWGLRADGGVVALAP